MRFRDKFYYGSERVFLGILFLIAYWVLGIVVRLYVIDSAVLASFMVNSLFIIVCSIIYLKVYNKRDKSSYHVTFTKQSVGILFSIFFVLFLATQSLGLWYYYSHPDDTAYANYTASANSLGVWIRFLFQVLCAPVAEELLFRGVFYNILKTKSKKHDYQMNWFTAALITSFMFAMMHGNMVQMITALLSGLWFVLIYELSKKLWLPIVMHILYNLLAQIAFIQVIVPYKSLVASILLVVVTTGLSIWMVVKLDTEHRYIEVQ